MFEYDPTTETVRDPMTGERLTTSGHYEDPLRHCAVLDRAGRKVFESDFIFETVGLWERDPNGVRPFHDVPVSEANGVRTVNYIFVSGYVLGEDGKPDRSDAACDPYFQRIGDRFVQESLSKTNVDQSTWRVERRKPRLA